MYIAVLGLHPRLSLAELIRLGGTASIHGSETAVLETFPKPDVGGSSKIAEVVDTLPTTDPGAIKSHIFEHIDSYMSHQFDSKMSFGISIYGAVWPRYKDLCLTAKKQLKSAGFRPRVVLGTGQTLNSAQVLHNGLCESKTELLVSIGDDTTHIARTVWVQDIDGLSKRDMQRPCRDMQTGMLPPKLARIMVNLAGGSHIFDPFCGSGVILQEALLAGKRASGSDVEPDMIECSRKNLDWLAQNFPAQSPQELFVADARKVAVPEEVDAIVSESYLGPPMERSPSREYIETLAEESGALLRDTLENMHPQLTKDTPVCLAAPAWEYNARHITPDIVSAHGHGGIDELNSLGYNRIDIDGVDPDDLLYRRHDQYVGRQLILLERV